MEKPDFYIIAFDELESFYCASSPNRLCWCDWDVTRFRTLADAQHRARHFTGHTILAVKGFEDPETGEIEYGHQAVE